jgi:hypothetical protein
MTLQEIIDKCEAFLLAPGGPRHPVPVLRSEGGRLLAYRHPADMKVAWNQDVYDSAAWLPEDPSAPFDTSHPELSVLLLLMDDRQRATGARNVRQKKLEEELAQARQTHAQNAARRAAGTLR